MFAATFDKLFAVRNHFPLCIMFGYKFVMLTKEVLSVSRYVLKHVFELNFYCFSLSKKSS